MGMKARINEPVLPRPDDRLLMIQLGHIGDVVVSLPVVRALKESAPHGKLVVAVSGAIVTAFLVVHLF